MPNYVLDTSATQVNSAINNVVNAQTTPSSGSSLMVTSDGIYQALNNIQHTNFNAGTLVTSTDTIASNNSDTQIPTTQAVSNAIHKLSTGWTTLAASGTAPSDGFLVVYVTGDTTVDTRVRIEVAGTVFDTGRIYHSSGTVNLLAATMTLPIASGESYSITVAHSTATPVIRFKALIPS
jgi:hypothetical protein